MTLELPPLELRLVQTLQCVPFPVSAPYAVAVAVAVAVAAAGRCFSGASFCLRKFFWCRFLFYLF